MLMQAQPLRDSINCAKIKIGKNTRVIYLSPQGKLINQNKIYKLIKNKKLILVCGRYKGIDERIISTEVDEELSIGNYILTGGELAAMVLIDAMIRLIPGVLQNNSSIQEDSLISGLLSCPHYTRPMLENNIKVPSILLSGNHKKIKLWRLKQSLGLTWIKRPDLLKKINLNTEQKKLLLEFKNEFYKNN